MKKSKIDSQGYYHEMQNVYLFQQMQQEKIQHENLHSSLLNRRVARNKCGGGKDESFLISVVPGISMLVRIFTPVTVIKGRTK